MDNVGQIKRATGSDAIPAVIYVAVAMGGSGHVKRGSVARYFKIEDECAQAVRLRLLAQQRRSG